MHKKVLSFVTAFVFSGVCLAQTVAPFAAGDRIAFVGNSITEHGYYESYIWLYYMLHYPGRRITVYNVGIGGDRAKNIEARLEEDVFGKKPSVVCMTFGMNDSGYFEYLQGNADSVGRAKAGDSKKYFDLMVPRLEAYKAARKIIIAGSLYDETAKGLKNLFPGKSRSMEQIASFQKQTADAHHWGYIDFLHPMTEITLREQKKDTAFTLTGPDRIHPGNAGHFVMAYLFLKQQGLSGKVVADMQIDAASKRVARSENCKLSNLIAGAGSVSFDYLANSLPFPQDTIARLWGNPQRQSEALSVIPFNNEMNKEMLTVKGLGAGSFEVKMDGRAIGRWTGEELASGINLALIPGTPEYEQAMTILWLNEERMAVESKVRQYYWLQFNFFKDRHMLFADDAEAMDSLNVVAPKDWFVGSKKDNYREARYAGVRDSWQKQMDLLVNEIYRLNQPRTHKITISKDN